MYKQVKNISAQLFSYMKMIFTVIINQQNLYKSTNYFHASSERTSWVSTDVK